MGEGIATLMVNPLVKCNICGKIMESADADEHKRETGHNSWELLLRADKDKK